jgi:hypothetical protein
VSLWSNSCFIKDKYALFGPDLKEKTENFATLESLQPSHQITEIRVCAASDGALSGLQFILGIPSADGKTASSVKNMSTFGSLNPDSVQPRCYHEQLPMNVRFN